MTKFIPTKDGLVNLDHVITIDDPSARGRRSNDPILVTYRCGEDVLTTAFALDDYKLHRFLDEFVPAHPDAFIWAASPDTDLSRPTEVTVRREAVVAWLVGRQYGQLTAIGYDDFIYGVASAGEDVVMVPCGDGKLFAPDLPESYENMDHAKRALLVHFQSQWDEKEARQAARLAGGKAA